MCACALYNNIIIQVYTMCRSYYQLIKVVNKSNVCDDFSSYDYYNAIVCICVRGNHLMSVRFFFSTIDQFSEFLKYIKINRLMAID